MEQKLHYTLLSPKYKNQPMSKMTTHSLIYFFQPALQSSRPGFGAGRSICMSMCVCVCTCVFKGVGARRKPIACAWIATLIHTFHRPVKQLVTTKAFGALSSDPAAMGPFFQMTKYLHNETTHCTCPEGEVPSSFTWCHSFWGPGTVQGALIVGSHWVLQPLKWTFPGEKGQMWFFIYVSYHGPVGKD